MLHYVAPQRIQELLESNQEIPQAQIADKPMVLRGRATRQSRGTRKTEFAK